MKKYLNVISALVLGFFCLGIISNSSAQMFSTRDAVTNPKQISKEEAAKKYPPPPGKSYPLAELLPTGQKGGFYRSPYSTKVYDLSTIPKGGLVLDENVNKVFVRP
jgi:hypothetical protein